MKKKLIILIVIIFSITGIAFSYSEIKTQLDNLSDIEIPETENVTEEVVSDVTYYKDLNEGIYIAKFPNTNQLDIIYDQEVLKNFELNIRDKGFRLAINGGYFLPEFSHAGLLRINETLYSSLALNDSQLTHVVMIGDSVEFISNLEYYNLVDSLITSRIDFQTGPLMIDKNVIQNNFIESSLNGNGIYSRVALGFTNNNEIFFVAARTPISLIDFSEYLLSLDLFADLEISVVNLDGGSSVAMYSSENNEFSFGLSKKLPIIIGIK